MSILKIGMYASQFPVGYGDPYWDDVIALIRCDGEIVNLAGGSVNLGTNSRFTESLGHLGIVGKGTADNVVKKIGLKEPLDFDKDYTIEFTLLARTRGVDTPPYPNYLLLRYVGGIRGMAIFGEGGDYDLRCDIEKDVGRVIASRVYLPKDSHNVFSITRKGNRYLTHVNGILKDDRISNGVSKGITEGILTIMGSKITGGGSPADGTLSEIRITQRARYSEANYCIDEPVFQQDKLPIPIYPKDPLYSDVVSLLRVQQGFLYDTKLNELTPRTTNNAVTGYYLDALKFANASHKRVVTLAEPLVGNFTFEFTFSLDAINESLPFEYLLRLMDGGSPQQSVVDVLRHEDEPNKLVLTGFVSESIDVAAGFNRFAMTKTGTSLKCYLNGELKTTTTLPLSSPISEIHLSSDTNPFSGTLEESRLTKGIRYAGNYTPSEEVFPTRTSI